MYRVGMNSTELTLFSESLKSLILEGLSKEVASGDTYEVSFARPGKDVFAPTHPTINIYLYDMTENMQLRENAWEAKKKDGITTTLERSPTRIDLGYRISCWSQGWDDEHDLLWMVLRILNRNIPLSLDALDPRLRKTQTRPIHMKVAHPGANLNTLTEFWSSLGGVLRPSFQLIATLEMPLSSRREVGPPVEDRVNLYENLAASNSTSTQLNRSNGSSGHVTVGGSRHRILSGVVMTRQGQELVPSRRSPVEVYAQQQPEVLATCVTDLSGRFSFRVPSEMEKLRVKVRFSHSSIHELTLDWPAQIGRSRHLYISQPLSTDSE